MEILPAIDQEFTKPGTPPAGTALLAGLIAAMFGEVLLSLTSPTFLNHPTGGLLGCIMALTTNALRRGPDSLSQS